MERDRRRFSRWTHLWKDLGQDLGYGLRVLRKARGFVVAAVASLSVGVIATTAAFGLVNAALFRSLPGVTDSTRLAQIFTVAPWVDGGAADEASYRRYREVLTSFSDVAGHARRSVAVKVGDDPFVATAILVTANYFDVLGTRPAAGHLVGESDSAHPVAVVSELFARRHFESAPQALGRGFRINGQPVEIIGVAPPRFGGVMPGEIGGDPAARPQVWVPMSMRAVLEVHPLLVARGGVARSITPSMSLVGRLSPGVSLDAARAQAAAVPPHAIGDRPADARPRVVPLGRGPGDSDAEIALVVALIFAVPLVVLAIGCANAANLQLARAANRRAEIAIRRLLGATRGRIVRQLLIESLIVAALAGAAGVIGTAILSRAFSDFVPIPVVVDWRVLTFACGAVGATGIAFGLVPAVGATRGDLTTPLRDAGSTAVFRRSRLRSGLVLAQVALSLVLLVVAGLASRSLQKLYGIGSGRELLRVAAAKIDLALLHYTPQQARAFQEELLARVDEAPGVVAAAVARFAPFRTSLMVYRRPEISYPPERPYEYTNGGAVLGRFVEAAGLRVIRGRGFTSADAAGEPKVALVSETLARRLSPSGDVIGRRLLVGESQAPNAEVSIVGVTADGALRLTNAEADAIFLPCPIEDRPYFTLWVRTAGDPADVLPHVRSIVRQIDPRVPIGAGGTAETFRATEVAELRLVARGVGVMGLLALALAGGGLYAVMSYLVASRRHELAVRLALGATPRRLATAVIGDGFRLTLPGIAVGALLSALAAQLVRTELFGISPFDPVSFLGVAAVLIGMSFAATLVPAVHASRLDPLATLRGH
jgi:predicted permease